MRVLVTFGGSPADAARKPVIAMKIHYYVSKLKKHGLEPVFVWPDMGVDLRSLYEWCDCVLLTGGGDFDASIYGEENHPTVDTCYPGRDEMEMEICGWVFADKKPVLGICRGMQALAISRGGKLLQHIPDLALDEKHGQSEHLHTVENMVKARDTHDVLIERDSRAFTIVGKDKALANSFHHQMVREPGEGMRIVGKSPKGVTELIESTDEKHFCFGIQSHPERFRDSDLEPFFEAFMRQ